jgi:hypothetical protein
LAAAEVPGAALPVLRSDRPKRPVEAPSAGRILARSDPIRIYHHEVAVGQHEIDFEYSDALRNADNAVTFKFALKVGRPSPVPRDDPVRLVPA